MRLERSLKEKKMYYPGPSFGAVSYTWDDEGRRYMNQKHNQGRVQDFS